MTDQPTHPESFITYRAEKELGQALGLSPNHGKTWYELLEEVKLKKTFLENNRNWIRSLAPIVGLEEAPDHIFWEEFLEDMQHRISFVMKEMHDRGEVILSHHRQLSDALGMEHGSPWEVLVAEVKAQTALIRDRDSAAVHDLTIQLIKALHIPPGKSMTWQALINLIQEYHHTLADAVDAGRSDHWKYLITKAEEQKRLLDLTERFRERLSDVAKWEEKIPTLSWESLLTRVGDLAKSKENLSLITKVEEQKRLLDLCEGFRLHLSEVVSKEKTIPLSSEALSWEALVLRVRDLAKATPNSSLESYEKLSTYHQQTETLKEELAKIHGMNHHLSWKEILTELPIPQEELEKARKTVASQLQRIKDLEQIIKDKATVLDKMTARVEVLEGEREQILDALDLFTGSALEDIMEKIGTVTVGFRSMADGKVVSYKVENPDALTYPAEAVKQAYENGCREGLAKAVDVARRVVQQTKEDRDAKRKAIEEAQAQKEKAEAEERKAVQEHIVAYDLLKMIEGTRVDEPAKATDFPVLYGPLLHVAQEKKP
jgi:hypothetical protein